LHLVLGTNVVLADSNLALGRSMWSFEDVTGLGFYDTNGETKNATLERMMDLQACHAQSTVHNIT